MLTKTKIALAAALILSTASVALAGTDQDEGSGGYVLPGNMDGVNPVYHPRIFGNPAAAQAYGFAPSANHTHRLSHERAR